MSLCHSLWMCLTLIGQQNVNGGVNKSWKICCGLRVKVSIHPILRYPVAFLIDSIPNGYTLITIHKLKPWVFFTFNAEGRVNIPCLCLISRQATCLNDYEDGRVLTQTPILQRISAKGLATQKGFHYSCYFFFSQ